MGTFFKQGDFPCPIYCRTRDKTDKHNAAGREFMESLWFSSAAFVDPDALLRATENMPTVFWELSLAHTLKCCGICLQPQARTKKNQKGPDLFATNPEAWIEAVMPGLGTGPDAMEYPPTGDSVPVRAFILRLQSVFTTKADIMAGYIRDGLIRTGQATIIAISGG